MALTPVKRPFVSACCSCSSISWIIQGQGFGHFFESLLPIYTQAQPFISHFDCMWRRGNRLRRKSVLLQLQT
jgi:hypothetical protein